VDDSLCILGGSSLRWSFLGDAEGIPRSLEYSTGASGIDVEYEDDVRLVFCEESVGVRSPDGSSEILMSEIDEGCVAAVDQGAL
jgi:hypothetical protein